MGASPEVVVDQRWSEFDLDQVYAGIGPLLAREDERFRLDYEQLQREVIDPESSRASELAELRRDGCAGVD